MSLADMHPEDIRAELRKRFGTITKFEDANNLPRKSVHEILRGRKSARVSEAIEKAIIEAPVLQSENSYSSREPSAHRLSGGVR